MFPFVSHTQLRIEPGDLKVAESDILPRIKEVLEDIGSLEITEGNGSLTFFVPMYSHFPRYNWRALPLASLIDNGEINLTGEERGWCLKLAFSHVRYLAISALPLFLGAAMLLDAREWLALGVAGPVALVGVSLWSKMGDIYMKTRLRVALCGPE